MGFTNPYYLTRPTLFQRISPPSGNEGVHEQEGVQPPSSRISNFEYGASPIYHILLHFLFQQRNSCTKPNMLGVYQPDGKSILLQGGCSIGNFFDDKLYVLLQPLATTLTTSSMCSCSHWQHFLLFVVGLWNWDLCN